LYHGTYALNSKVSRSAGILFKELLLNALHISLSLSPLCYRPLRHITTRLFQDMCTSTHLPWALNRDAHALSRSHSRFYCCKRIDSLSVKVKAFKLRVNHYCSILTEKILALCRELDAVGNLPSGSFLLCADILSTTEGLQLCDIIHPLVLEMCTINHEISSRDL
jgi:hypothetical protein